MTRWLLVLCLVLPTCAQAFGPAFKGPLAGGSQTWLFVGGQYGQLTLGSADGELMGAEVVLLHAFRGGDDAFVGGLVEVGEALQGESRVAAGLHAGWAGLAVDVSGVQISGESGLRARAHLNIVLLGLWTGVGQVGGHDLFEAGASLRLPIPLGG